MTISRETEFMAFLGLIEKLINDIRRLDQKFLDEVLLEKTYRLKLEIFTLQTLLEECLMRVPKN